MDLCNKDICPVTIKLLGVLRMLGRNWICDDVAEATGMGESTVRRAFKLFDTFKLFGNQKICLCLRMEFGYYAMVGTINGCA